MSELRPGFAVGLACGLVVPFIWGGWIVASRFGVLNALTPYDVAALRVGVGAIIVLPLLLTRGLAGLPLWKGAVLSFGVGAPFALASFGGMSLAPVIHAGVLTNGTMPIFATIVGYLWLRERPTRVQAGGIVLIVVGALMLGGGQFYGSCARRSVVRRFASDRGRGVFCDIYDRAAALECQHPAGGDRGADHQHGGLHSDLAVVSAFGDRPRSLWRCALPAMVRSCPADSLPRRCCQLHRGDADHPGDQVDPGDDHGGVPCRCTRVGRVAGYRAAG